MSKLEEEIGHVLANDCRTPRGCVLDHDNAINEILTLFSETIEEVIGEAQPQFLTKNRLKEDMAWCNGRNKLRQEQRQRAHEILGKKGRVNE